MIHAMIDLETLSTSPNAVILTVGGVKFDPSTQMKPYNEMYFRMDVDSQTQIGRNVQQSTLDWWATQPNEISEEALGDGNRISIEDACKQINKFSSGVDVFWCQGPLFDYAILQNLYSQLGKPLPWNFWQIRDSRTLFSLVPREKDYRTGLHNALEDCKFQANKVQKVYRQLGIK